jgi:hypothetical protein
MSPSPSVDIVRSHFGPAKMFEPFYRDATFADVRIASALEPTLTLRAHRIVLAAASSHLAKKIREQRDGNGVIIIRNISFNMLSSVLDLIYAGRVSVRRDEEEDFFQCLRMLYVRLDAKTNGRVYDDTSSSPEAASSASKSALEEGEEDSSMDSTVSTSTSGAAAAKERTTAGKKRKLHLRNGNVALKQERCDPPPEFQEPPAQAPRLASQVPVESLVDIKPPPLSLPPPPLPPASVNASYQPFSITVNNDQSFSSAGTGFTK